MNFAKSLLTMNVVALMVATANAQCSSGGSAPQPAPVYNPPAQPYPSPPVYNPPVYNPPVYNPPVAQNPPTYTPGIDPQTYYPPVYNPPLAQNPPVYNPPVYNPPVYNPPPYNPGIEPQTTYPQPAPPLDPVYIPEDGGVIPGELDLAGPGGSGEVRPSPTAAPAPGSGAIQSAPFSMEIAPQR